MKVCCEMKNNNNNYKRHIKKLYIDKKSCI